MSQNDTNRNNETYDPTHTPLSFLDAIDRKTPDEQTEKTDTVKKVFHEYDPDEEPDDEVFSFKDTFRSLREEFGDSLLGKQLKKKKDPDKKKREKKESKSRRRKDESDGRTAGGFYIPPDVDEDGEDSEYGIRSSKPETRQLFRMNHFQNQSRETREFMKNCYNNTFQLNFPQRFQGFLMPEVFKEFYLHFSFENDEHSFSHDVVRANIEWYVKTIQRKETGNSEILCTALVPYCTDKDAATDEEELGHLVMQIRFSARNDRIYQLELSLPEQQKRGAAFWGKFKKPEKGAQTNDSGSPVTNSKVFPDTTLRNAVFYDGTQQIMFGKESYHPVVKCYYSFSRITCPFCLNAVRDFGIPGIVLYTEQNDECTKTSAALQTILNAPPTEIPYLQEMAKYATLRHIDHNIAIGSHQKQEAREALQDLSRQNSYLRIPLGEYPDGDDGVKPFTSNDYRKEQTFLNALNKRICPDLTQSMIDEHGDALFLLKPGHITDTNMDQYYIHSTMIQQLCKKCFSPLPHRFYEYDMVITVRYFGNSNAGKTALICAEYNAINTHNREHTDDQIDSQILNTFSVRSTREDDDRSYEYIARRLEDGKYPNRGTEDGSVIPSKLSDLEVCFNGISRRYLFNCYDMPGSQSVSNWDSAHSFAYVHTLLDNPEAFAADSFFGTLSQIIPYRQKGQNANSRTYNIQIYLTKIDEYPAFIHDALHTLNQEYAGTDWEYAAMLNTHNAAIDLESIYLRQSLLYTFAVFECMEQCLSVDLREQYVSSVIKPEILSILKQMFPALSDDTMRFGAAFDLLCDECLAEGRKTDKRVQLILRYLHGLVCFQRNYSSLRRFVCEMLVNMKSNADANTWCNFFLAVYAVSATGFGGLEAECGTAQFRPEFLWDAHKMLRHTTYTFDLDNREIRKTANEDVPEHSRCYRLMFEAFDLNEGDFREEQLSQWLEGSSFCDAINRMVNQHNTDWKVRYMQGTKVDELHKWYNETVENVKTMQNDQQEVLV